MRLARWRELREGPRTARVSVYAALAYGATFVLLLGVALVTGDVELAVFAMVAVLVLSCLHAVVVGAGFLAIGLVRRARRARR